MPTTENQRISNHSTRLLVSIRNSEEADLAIRHGVDWIDAKDPGSGALGRPTLESAEDIHSRLADHASRSVALGELYELQNNAQAYEEALQLARLFPVVKVGMSNMRRENWQSLLRQLQGDADRHGCQVVPVYYADGVEHDVPEWDEFMRFLDNPHPTHEPTTKRRMLIDTFGKNNRNLLDHLPVDHVRQCLEDCSQRNTRLVLAGSLRSEQISVLLGLGAEAIGVRGAVCTRDETEPKQQEPNNANRRWGEEERTRMGSLCPEKLKTITSLFKKNRGKNFLSPPVTS